MTFEQWWAENGVGYSSYEDFARDIWTASREGVVVILSGIDTTETEADNGWWETSKGAEFGAAVLAKIKETK